MIPKDEAKQLQATLDMIGIAVGMGWDTESIALGWVLGRHGFRPGIRERAGEVYEELHRKRRARKP